MADSKHTPTPWRVTYDDNGFYFIWAEGAPSPYIVATGGEGETDEANCTLIARAVNEREGLRAALERCQKILAHLIDPVNKGSGISNMLTWVGCVAAEKIARETLADADKASVKESA